MELSNNNLMEVIKMVQEKLMEYVEYGLDICIQLHFSDKTTVRNTVVIDEFQISESGLYIVAGWEQINCPYDLTEINYIKDDNSLHIKFINGNEIYLNPDDAI